VIGTEEVGGRTALTVEKPTETSGEFVFNSQFEIPALANTGVGWAYRHEIIVMKGDGVAPTAANVQYSPVVASWEITEGAGPFVVFGEHSAATNALIGKMRGGSGVERGIIIAYLGCGYATIKRATWTSGDEPAACADLITITGEDTTGCAASITYPACPFTAVGAEMRGYCEQWKAVGVVVGHGCYFIDKGVTELIDDVEVPVMEIISALPNHVVAREEVWDCCEGEGETNTETLISFTPLVLVGFRGDSVTCGTCEPPA
jgi:hypothetical protein